MPPGVPSPHWVKGSPRDYVGIASAIPLIAYDLLQRPSRPSRAISGLLHGNSGPLFDRQSGCSPRRITPANDFLRYLLPRAALMRSFLRRAQPCAGPLTDQAITKNRR